MEVNDDNPNENDDKEEIMEHVEEHNDNSNVTCEFCDKTFVNLKEVKLHAYQIHAINLLHMKCPPRTQSRNPHLY